MPSVGGIKAGNAYVVIGAIDDTGKMLAKIGRNLRNWGSSLTGMGLDAMFKGFLALTPAAMGLNTFMKFDDLMKQTEARTGATGQQMQVLSASARKAGADIGLTAVQIAAMFAELSTRDFSVGDMDKMVRPIALMAKATGKGSDKDMSQSASLMSLAIQAFKMNAGDAAHIADTLTVAANKSNFALDDLREALSSIGPLAHQMGMGFEETVAILAQMRNVEIDASSAGIGLRNILLNSAGTKGAQDFNKALEAMGETAIKFVDKMGNLKEGTALLFEVFSKIRKFGTGVKAGLLEGLFGKRAITPAIAAGSSQDKFEELLKAMQNSNGEAEKISRTMETGFGGAVRRVINALVDLSITFGQSLEPLLQRASKLIVEIITAINEWIDKNRVLTTGIVASVLGLFAFGAAMVVTGLTVKALGLAVSALSLIFLAFDGVRKIVVIGMTILKAVVMTGIAAFNLLWAAMLVGKAVALSVYTAFSLIITGIELIQAAVAGLSLIISAIGAAPVLVMIGFGLIAMAGMMAVVGAVGVTAFRAIGGAATSVFDMITSVVKGVSGWLGDMWNIFSAKAMKAFQEIKIGMGLAFDLAQAGHWARAAEISILSLKLAFLEVKLGAMIVFRDLVSNIEIMFNQLMLKVAAMTAKLAFQLENPTVQGKALENQFDMIDMAMNMGNAGMVEALKGGDAAENKKDREDLDKIKDDWMWEVDPNNPANTFKDKNAPEWLKVVGNPSGAGPLGNGMDVGSPAATLKALEGMEKGTLEAAKAAYEGSPEGQMGDIQRNQLSALQGIEQGIDAINQNLQVA